MFDYFLPQVPEKPEEKPSFDVVEDEKKGKPLPTVEKTLNVVYESPEVKTVEKSLDGSVTITDSKPAAVPGDAPKKSYASIVSFHLKNLCFCELQD